MPADINFKHGIYTTEVSTSITPLAQITMPTVAIGTAPVHLATDAAEPNTPVLCSTLREFVEQFGWSDDFESYTLCEAARVHFSLYGIAPVIFINVLNPLKHAKTTTVEVTGTSAPVTLSQPIVAGSIKVTTEKLPTTKTLIGIIDEDAEIDIPAEITGDFTLTAGDNELDLTTDYTINNGKISLTDDGKLKFDGALTFTAHDGGETVLVEDDDYTIERGDTATTLTLTIAGAAKVTDDKIKVTFREIDATAVTSSTIIGGVDTMTGDNLGIECVEDIYPKLGVVPGTLIAPKFSTDSVVAATLAAKAKSINGCFKTIAIADLPTDAATKYNNVNLVKTGKNFVDGFLVSAWSKVTLSGEQYHLSTHLAALMCAVDAARGDIPFKSPSNEYLQVDGMCLADGKPVYLGKSTANYINGLGVVTALNFGGWRSWGNYTSAFPDDSNPINFISVRRMMNWICNMLTVNFFSRIDSPMNRVLVDAVLDSVRLWLNGLAKSGAILGGDIAFLEEDNPTNELALGNMVFRMDVGFAVPAQKIQFTVQFNHEYFSALFS
ncbi:MAG: hypothetical protein IJ774_05425 [Selenomonadaceae bacterium]|nr:hypothetical protein [Selenomonadaceae bacterium]MBR1805815.1 hypothetical protein [Selenomonadaceae bacterium]